MQQHLGVDTQEITKEELKEIDSRFDLSDVHRLTYEKTSGYCDPHDTTYCYVQRFRDQGGVFIQMTAAEGLILEKDVVKGVRTKRGDISTGTVVNAAGPWAHYIGKWAGLDVPIKVTREEEIILETAGVGGGPKLGVSDMCKVIYYRPEGRTHTLLGRRFPKDYEYIAPDHYREAADIEFIEDTTRRLVERFPCFEKALFLNAYTGLYDITPDWYPILGKVDGVRSFYMCAGFSGHGFKLAPSIGELMAEEVIDGKAYTIDISHFSLSRFEKG